MKVAIIGAGIHGSSAALSLVQREHEVQVFDRHPSGHTHGSSHGRSRIIRKAYPDPFYTQIMGDAYGLWDQLQSQSELPIVHHCGILYFGSKSSATLSEVESALSQNGVGFDPAENGEKFEIHLEDDERGIFSRDGGWVNADLAVAETQRLAKSLGAKFGSREIRSVSEFGREFDRLVIAPGAWISDFAPVNVEVRVQTVAYVRLNWNGPVWIEEGPDFLYGFPTATGESTVKIGVHLRGTTWDLRSPRPQADPHSIELIREFVRKRFETPNPKVDEVVTCLYAMTPDEDFRWGWLDERSLYLSACSGHGFKFGPWFGERIADLIEGKSKLSDYPRFISD